MKRRIDKQLACCRIGIFIVDKNQIPYRSHIVALPVERLKRFETGGVAKRSKRTAFEFDLVNVGAMSNELIVRFKHIVFESKRSRNDFGKSNWRSVIFSTNASCAEDIVVNVDVGSSFRFVHSECVAFRKFGNNIDSVSVDFYMAATFSLDTIRATRLGTKVLLIVFKPLNTNRIVVDFFRIFCASTTDSNAARIIFSRRIINDVVVNLLTANDRKGVRVFGFQADFVVVDDGSCSGKNTSVRSIVNFVAGNNSGYVLQNRSMEVVTRRDGLNVAGKFIVSDCHVGRVVPTKNRRCVSSLNCDVHVFNCCVGRVVNKDAVGPRAIIPALLNCPVLDRCVVSPAEFIESGIVGSCPIVNRNGDAIRAVLLDFDVVDDGVPTCDRRVMSDTSKDSERFRCTTGCECFLGVLNSSPVRLVPYDFVSSVRCRAFKPNIYFSSGVTGNAVSWLIVIKQTGQTVLSICGQRYRTVGSSKLVAVSDSESKRMVAIVNSVLKIFASEPFACCSSRKSPVFNSGARAVFETMVGNRNRRRVVVSDRVAVKVKSHVARGNPKRSARSRHVCLQDVVGVSGIQNVRTAIGILRVQPGLRDVDGPKVALPVRASQCLKRAKAINAAGLEFKIPVGPKRGVTGQVVRSRNVSARQFSQSRDQSSPGFSRREVAAINQQVRVCQEMIFPGSNLSNVIGGQISCNPFIAKLKSAAVTVTNDVDRAEPIKPLYCSGDLIETRAVLVQQHNLVRIGAVGG